MKYFCLLPFVFLATICCGQKIGVAIKLGGGLANQHIDNHDVISTKNTGSFNFGGMAIYKMRKDWELQAGLSVAQKGAVITEDAITTTQHAIYLDLPVNLIKSFLIEDLGAYYIGFGGYAARGMGGKNTFQTPNSQTSANLEFRKDGDLQRYDAGVNFTTGFKLNNRLIFDISYQLGLANLATSPLKDTGTKTINNRMITVSLGYTIR